MLNERTPTSSLNSNSESKVITFTGNDLSTFLRRKGVILNIESVTRLVENQSDHSVTLYLHVYGYGMNQNYIFFLFYLACINTQDLWVEIGLLTAHNLDPRRINYSAPLKRCRLA